MFANLTAAKAFAWAGFALGTVVSVAANVTHAAEGDWSPAELVGAAFWPIALMLSVEILTRRDSSRDHWVKSVGLALGLVVVAGVAAFLSYMHMAGLLQSWGEAAWSAHLGPLAVDGLMLVSGLALLPDRTQQQVTVDRRHVFEWPVPIGPREPSEARHLRQSDQLAATAYAGPELDDEDDEPMLDRILKGIPDTPQIPLHEGDHRHVGFDAPIGPAPAPAAKPRPAPERPKPKPKAPAKAAKKTTEVSPEMYDQAYRYWQANPDVTGTKIAEIAGVGRATGYRWLTEWNATKVSIG